MFKLTANNTHTQNNDDDDIDKYKQIMVQMERKIKQDFTLNRDRKATLDEMKTRVQSAHYFIENKQKTYCEYNRWLFFVRNDAIIKLNHVASHHLPPIIISIITFFRAKEEKEIFIIIMQSSIIYSYAKRKSMVCWRRRNCKVKMAHRDWARERERVCQECVQLTFSIHICSEPSEHIAIYGMVCARTMRSSNQWHTDQYSLKCVPIAMCCCHSCRRVRFCFLFI